MGKQDTVNALMRRGIDRKAADKLAEAGRKFGLIGQ